MINKKHQPRALRILEALAQGVDPYTGEVLKESSPFNNVETVRILYQALHALKEKMEQKRDPADLPQNAGKPWPKESLDELWRGFKQGLSVDLLAEKHQRTRGAIESQLMRLVLLDEQKKLKQKD